MARRGSGSRKSFLSRLLQRRSLDIIIVKVGQVSLCFGIKLDIGAGLPGGEEESFVVLRGGGGVALGRPWGGQIYLIPGAPRPAPSRRHSSAIDPSWYARTIQ